MTPEEKVALLKKAGVWDVIGYPTCIDKLFDLVAAHEREACAKVCDERADSYKYATDPWAHEHISEANICAAAIRAGGKK